ncbi:MAG: DUF502 domain-containing protein [Myxococcota bacterium]
MRTVREVLRRYFVAGVLLFAPLGITLWAMAWIIQRLDNLILPHLLRLLRPGVDAPQLPFVGALFTLLVILLFGVVARHLFGNEVVRISERALARVPVARSIYGGVKQLIEAILFADTRESFRRVVLLEYPRRGMYAIAFTTGPSRGAVQDASPEPMLNCFVPTTPNPTSGFYLLVPVSDVVEVDLSVEEAFKLVMSAGLVAPGERGAATQPPATLPLTARKASS